MKIVIATSNRGKIAELATLLPQSVELLSLADANLPSPEEDGATFLENALLKARAAALSGMTAMADDSGLEVDALGGAPGVHSARYAGPFADDAANNLKLLEELREVGEAERTARFRSIVALVTPTGFELAADGQVEGRIACVPRGKHGFGYDPLFLITDAEAMEFAGRTMAELVVSEKNQISHRSRAYRALLRALANAHNQHELTELTRSTVQREPL